MQVLVKISKLSFLWESVFVLSMRETLSLMGKKGLQNFGLKTL
jgi:hypothetical protein